MRTFPEPSERKRLDAVVVRTDHAGGRGWRALCAAAKLGGTGEWPLLFVEGADWAGATADEVREAAGDRGLDVVFVADRTALAGHGLLALEVSEPSREFRVVPGWVMLVHGTLAITGVAFDEFVKAADEDPEGLFRGFW